MCVCVCVLLLTVPQAARLHSRWVDVQAEVARAVAEYDAQTSGPTKWPRLTAFLQQQYGHMVADFVQRCEAEADKKVGSNVCVRWRLRLGGNTWAVGDPAASICMAAVTGSHMLWEAVLQPVQQHGPGCIIRAEDPLSPLPFVLLMSQISEARSAAREAEIRLAAAENRAKTVRAGRGGAGACRHRLASVHHHAFVLGRNGLSRATHENTDRVLRLPVVWLALCVCVFVQVEIQVKDLATAEASLRQELAHRHSSGGGGLGCIPCMNPAAKY